MKRQIKKRNKTRIKNKIELTYIYNNYSNEYKFDNEKVQHHCSFDIGFLNIFGSLLVCPCFVSSLVKKSKMKRIKIPFSSRFGLAHVAEHTRFEVNFFRKLYKTKDAYMIVDGELNEST